MLLGKLYLDLESGISPVICPFEGFFALKTTYKREALSDRAFVILSEKVITEGKG